jgi:transcriptional regulator with XRE-family HTH domain
MRSLLPEQCRAARGLLDWTQEQLATLAGVSRSTVRDFEGCRRGLHQTTEALLIKAFEGAGVRLVFDRREPGVRLRTNGIASHRSG